MEGWPIKNVPDVFLGQAPESPEFQGRLGSQLSVASLSAPKIVGYRFRIRDPLFVTMCPCVLEKTYHIVRASNKTTCKQANAWIENDIYSRNNNIINTYSSKKIQRVNPT